jgi:hypothetical protein
MVENVALGVYVILQSIISPFVFELYATAYQYAVKIVAVIYVGWIKSLIR